LLDIAGHQLSFVYLISVYGFLPETDQPEVHKLNPKMFKKFLLHFSNRFVSHYVVLASDILIVVLSLILAYIIRFNFDLTDMALWKLPTYLPIVTGISILSFIITRSYIGIIRHTSIDDVFRIFKAVLAVAIVLVLLNTLILFYKWPLRQVLPLGVIIINSLITLFLMVFTRLMAKVVWFNFARGQGNLTNVMIFGAGKAGMLTKNALLTDLEKNYNVICFVDDAPGKIGKTLEGIPVVDYEHLNPQFIIQKNIQEIILAVHKIDPVKKRQIADFCLQLNVNIKDIPPVDMWIDGVLQARQIKNVRIEDLLQREPIILNNSVVLSENKGHVILVTGAAGSIGSEISRQLMHMQAGSLILLDQAETPLHDLSLKFRHTFTDFDKIARPVIADVSDPIRMEWVFDRYKPQVVYHAAAYKHVPMMEVNPFEAIKVNVFGTRLLADLSVRHNVGKFVMVSTDKAVNTSNVMGATKRLAEIYTQSLSTVTGHDTRFITTRFGNVLGSNGSVIPIFRQQIEEGGPVTVTHPDITRFFMTIPEACELVLEAGAMGKGGEIFMFDMGQPVRIIDLARNMIRLSGLQPDKDIEIVINGLRPGEKLYEELLNNNENTIPTHHPRILIARVSPMEFGSVGRYFEKLEGAWKSGDDFKMVSVIKEIIPDFKSNNSIFEFLDKQDTITEKP
jgi:FlaA1/EpsC-like NDP-sugar epimerase